MSRTPPRTPPCVLTLLPLLLGRCRRLVRDDRGMSTAEYAIGTIAAAAFAALLYTVISGDSVVGALTRIIARALTTTF